MKWGTEEVCEQGRGQSYALPVTLMGRPWGWVDSGKEGGGAEGRRRDGNRAGRRERKESLPGGGKGGSGHCISAGFAVMLLRSGDDDKAGCGQTTRVQLQDVNTEVWASGEALSRNLRNLHLERSMDPGVWMAWV